MRNMDGGAAEPSSGLAMGLLPDSSRSPSHRARSRFSSEDYDSTRRSAPSTAAMRAGQGSGPPPGTESLDFDLHESSQYVDYVTKAWSEPVRDVGNYRDAFKRHLGRAPEADDRVRTRHWKEISFAELSGLDNASLLDVFPVQVKLEASKMKRKLKGGIRWLLIVAVGAATGLTAVVIDIMVENLFSLRFKAVAHLVKAHSSVFLQYLAFVGPCLVLAGIAGILVCFVEPLAAGSGIPEVKCYLNGVDLKNVVNFRTYLAKAPGVMCSVSAGLPCGKEGPMIHSGAILGSTISQASTAPLLQPYRSDTEVRDFVVAGAASGVAAAFSAPLGGVLFAIEEGASHMNPSIMLRTFVCATAAALASRFLLAPLETHVPWGTMGAAAPLSFGHFALANYNILELPLFMFMGSFGGLCGAFFNGANTALTKWRMRNISKNRCLRFLEVMVVTMTVASFHFVVPIWDGVGPSNVADIDSFSPTERLFWDPGGSSIKHLFHDKEEFEPGLLTFFGITYYVLACWTYGLAVPSGLFVPSLLTGAAFGRLFGQAVAHITDGWSADPGIYALMGATAFLSGMARITISLAVILMEATGSSVFALPIFVTVMLSKWTGDVFNHGLYDIHIGLKEIPLLESFPEKEMIIMRAGDVMNSDVLSVLRVETVGHLIRILESCEHHAFPVQHHATKRFVGTVKRSTLHVLLHRGRKHGLLQPADRPLSSATPVMPYEELSSVFRNYPSLSEIKQALSDDPDICQMRIDLKPYMNRGGYTVPEHAALTRVYMLFRTMGLRHLPVVSHDGDVCGIITRKDLILAHGDPHRQDLEQSIIEPPQPRRMSARRNTVLYDTMQDPAMAALKQFQEKLCVAGPPLNENDEDKDLRIRQLEEEVKALRAEMAKDSDDDDDDDFG
eukprot:TRINITY_DN58845_c0_g1_i1.p1 TRINITY_DN58845_c0_g1~~TRINITY_DN58845_c0_g1_i1.p1  ORF type:complete len:900 (-),score=127.65 TRINITY_DN58845_c0_g1_i1:49-2748(-)